MNVLLYSGFQTLVEKSGVGQALYHQQSAANYNGYGLVTKLANADVVHINTLFLRSLHMAHRAHRRKIPVVYHAHSTKEDFRNSYLGSNLIDGLYGKWIKRCYNSGDIIVTPTAYSKCLLESYGIKKKIVAISNGIDLSYYDRTLIQHSAFRALYGYLPKDKIIMSVGLTIDRKGILDFVALAKWMPQYQFIWFGETNLNTVPFKVRKAVKTKLPNLKFAGFATKDVLREAYASCDLFLFPSKEETEGIVVLEALAMKIPVLLRDIPVYEDWITKDVDAYKATNLEDFETQARNIINGRCPSLVESGHKVVEQRSIEAVGAQLRKVYEDVVNMRK